MSEQKQRGSKTTKSVINTEGVDAILVRWKAAVKGKMRVHLRPRDAMHIKIESIKRLMYSDVEPLEGWEYRRFRYDRKRERHYLDDDWQAISVGEEWGGPDISAMFRCTGRIPQRFAGQKVVLKIYFGGDSLLYVNGLPYHGLDPFRDTVLLTKQAAGDERYDFQAESYIMWHSGEPEMHPLECSAFAVVDSRITEAYWDLRSALNVVTTEGMDPDVVGFLESVLSKALLHIHQNEPCVKTAQEGVLRAQQILKSALQESQVFRKEGLLHLCGHSHLDLVYLWTHAEFVRKLGRTHATALRLLEEYPEYIFSQSQPLMYKEMQAVYPTMFEEVRQRVREGRWEPIGAMWVEPDCNLLSGESFVRQILHGVQFYEEQFGVTPKTAWLPDVFGNTWTMPQILCKAGLKYFVTHKVAVWNDTNPWDKSVFWWQGPDGSRILAVVPPTHFVGTNEPDLMKQHWDEFTAKDTIGESLYCYGWGDGGGGPDPEMLEYLKRYGNYPGMVPTKPSRIEDALESIHRKALRADIPVFNDELYLEQHRGTFTTKGWLKRLNRYCEHLYRKAEMFSCLADVKYPAGDLRKGWEEILTNQFHDSLPGTHVEQTYADLREAYSRAVEIGESALGRALEAISSHIDTRGPGQPVVVFNDREFPRDTLARIDLDERKLSVVDEQGHAIPHQFLTNFETGRTQLAFVARDLPAVGYRVYWLAEAAADTSGNDVHVDTGTLENDKLRVKVDSQGRVLSLLDKSTGRECIDPQQGANVLKLFEDEPGGYEAWDLVKSYKDVELDLGCANVDIVERGPVRSALQFTRRFGNSTMIQRIVLTAGASRLDFETYVDWHEQRKLLKTYFHTSVNARRATCDIAFGNIERSCYHNTSFDAARFEVPAHLWMDLSQNDCGVSLLNDCKYGHEVFGQMMGLTLLRGPKIPDPNSDQEKHYFTYSLYPHSESWQRGRTVEEALDLNHPADVLICKTHEGILSKRNSFISIDGEGVYLEAVKKAEDDNYLVLRLVERWGGSQDVIVHLPAPVAEVRSCNLLEREDQPVPHESQSFRVHMNPYEIQTFKVLLVEDMFGPHIAGRS